jgi:hypothetical protein
MIIGINQNNKQEVIVDSSLNFEQSVSSLDFPAEIRANLKLVDVQYYSFDNKLHKGQVVVNKDLADDIIEIFKEIEHNKFPIAKVIPVNKYNWSDSASMLDNNTSAFNYRVIKGTTRLSKHSYGRAIDINPWLNPEIINKEVLPEGAVYDPHKEGTITGSSFIVKLFKQKGWEWGGDWKNYKDYQHFEKTAPAVK